MHVESMRPKRGVVMRNRMIGALVFLLILAGTTLWHSARHGRRMPRLPVQPAAVPIQRAPAAPIQRAPDNSDKEVERVLRDGVSAFRKMLDDSPNVGLITCTNTAHCIAMVPGLKVPTGIRINLYVTMRGEASGEAGRAGSGRSYYYYEGAPSVEVQNKEADQWVLDADGNPTPIP